MKQFYLLSTFAVFVVIGFFGTVYAIPPFTPQEIFDFSDVIVVGKVVSVNPTFTQTQNLYEIHVEKYLKNTLTSETIFASGQNTEISKIGNIVFKEGDRGLFFLNNYTVGYDAPSKILSVHPTSMMVEPEWDECNIFENEIPPEHWPFGGTGSGLMVSQDNRDDNFITGKRVTISHDFFNPENTTKKVEFGIIIKNIDEPDSLYEFTESTDHILEPCTTYETITWSFTPNDVGHYFIEFNDYRGWTLSKTITVNNASGLDDIPNLDLDFGKSTITSPLKQFKSGIAVGEIQCRDSLILVTKYNGAPACIKSENHKKMYERGWTKIVPIKPEIGKTGKYSLEIEDGSKFNINYSIEGAAILSMDARAETESILINLDAPYDGSLTISIPRQIADAKDVNGIDDIPFLILVEGEEVSSEEISSTSENRTITIPFEKRTKEIEIIGADYI